MHPLIKPIGLWMIGPCAHIAHLYAFHEEAPLAAQNLWTTIVDGLWFARPALPTIQRLDFLPPIRKLQCLEDWSNT